MRSRIERVARAEQRQLADKELSARVDELLQTLACHIAVCAPRWAAQVSASSRKESTDRVSGAASLAWGGWHDAELTDVCSTMMEVQELVDLNIVRPRDAAAATINSVADGVGSSSAAATESISGASAVPESSVRFHAAFVHQIITRLFVSVTTTALSSVVPPGRAHGVPGAAAAAGDDTAIVQCIAPSDVSSLFPVQSMLRLPASIYIGWRCGYSLLNSIEGILRVADDDCAAAWLDVTSATLHSLLDAAHACGSDASAAAAPNAAAALHHFTVCAETQALFMHCMWWWCSLVFERGYSHGLLAAPSSAPSLESAVHAHESKVASSSSTTTTTATTAGGCSSSSGATMHTSLSYREEYRVLWTVGRVEAAAYLSATVLPTVADYLQAALERFVFFTATSSPQLWSKKSAELTEAVQAVRGLADRLFPSPASATSAFPPAPSPSSHRQLSAATTSFLRHAVHDALLPLAERVLDNQGLLQDHITPTVDAISIAAAVKAPATAQGGWSSSGDEEWEEVPVAGGANGALLSPEASALAKAPPNTLIYALDALEREFGDVVRADSVAMTLRRL
ncbi:hypothetical protein Q4I32_002236 [Leishmania shawi]|uniref:Uncharacterized protein n=1 Tax=Leishmania shawi TaxID=5680 RepID=A0AAW3C567_9TRYP